MSSHSEELTILSVHGKGEGPLALHGHDALFTVSELEALNSLSADHSVVKSLERGERLVRREELTGQVGNHLLIHNQKERLPLLQLQHTPIEVPSMIQCVISGDWQLFCADERIFLVFVSFFIWKAADPRHCFNPG